MVRVGGSASPTCRERAGRRWRLSLVLSELWEFGRGQTGCLQGLTLGRGVSEGAFWRGTVSPDRVHTCVCVHVYACVCMCVSVQGEGAWLL